MQSNKHVFVFKATQNNMALLECVSVQEAGEYSVSVHEIHDGVVQEHISSLLKNVTVQSKSVPLYYKFIQMYFFQFPL